MGVFLSYSIIAGLCMLAMYLAYKLFLACDNQHGFNRAVLLGIYFLSFGVAPFAIRFRPASAPTPGMELTFSEVIPATKVADAPIWGTVVIWIFIAGMAAVALRTLLTWLRLASIVRRGQKIEREGYTLVLTDSDRYAPFSWMRYIVLPRKDFDDGSDAIATHELTHVRALHWLDLMLAQAVCTVNWFNPAAWLMRDELMLIHEYQADMAVMESGHDMRQYQLLLIKKAVGSRFPSLANSLNHSKLKKRITMMYKEKSGAGRKFKALALVPMLALALGLASVPAVRAAVATISDSELSTGKDSEKSADGQTSVKALKFKSLNNNGNVTTIVLRGEDMGSNMNVSGGTFTTAGKTYQATGLEATLNDGVAVIKAKFPFTDNYENSSMTLVVNGQTIKIDLQPYFDKADPVKFASSPEELATKPSIAVVNLDSTSVKTDMKILVNGKEVTAEELKSISPEGITEVTVDKQSGQIKIRMKE